jgi:2-keto-4-pentenoate hydratase
VSALAVCGDIDEGICGMLSSATRAGLAADLAEAERTRVPMAPLTAAHPDIDVVDAYEIQLINIRQRIAEGATVAGHKVGLSSKAMQEMMGVDEPDYGHLLADMEVFEDVAVPAGRYLFPRVEVEVGFILADDLPGAGCTEDDVLAATAAFVPAIELIDTRITDWKIALCDTIADNASSAGWVLGPQRRGAGQPGDRGCLAGPQGRQLRGATEGRRYRAARFVHPRHRRPTR